MCFLKFLSRLFAHQLSTIKCSEYDYMHLLASLTAFYHLIYRHSFISYSNRLNFKRNIKEDGSSRAYRECQEILLKSWVQQMPLTSRPSSEHRPLRYAVFQNMFFALIILSKDPLSVHLQLDTKPNFIFNHSFMWSGKNVTVCLFPWFSFFLFYFINKSSINWVSPLLRGTLLSA